MHAESKGRPSRRAGLCGIAGLFAGLVLVPAVATGFPDEVSSRYSDSGSSCGSNGVDPVTVMFTGDQATAANVSGQIARDHASWTNESGSLQSLGVRVNQDPGDKGCDEMDAQRANGSSTDNRKHIRIWRVPYYDGENKKVQTTPHHEDFVLGPSCFGNHAVDSNGDNGSGFDRGRVAVREIFADAGHDIDAQLDWGNTRNFLQCDGDYARSNGNGVRIGMGHTH